MTDPIKTIRTDEQHAAALREVDRLWRAKPGSPEFDRLDRLAAEIERYEDRCLADSKKGAQ